MHTISSLLDGYEKGYYTRGELLNAIVGLAVATNPSHFMPDVPAEYVPALRDAMRDLPKSMDELLMIGSCTSLVDHDGELARKAKEDYFKAIWTMHRYFFGNEA